MPEDPKSIRRASAIERATRIEAVVFDLDGTLIDTIDLIRISMRYATRNVLGRVVPDEELMRNVGVPLSRQMREFDPKRADELLRVYRQYNSERHDELAAIYPGTLAALKWLQNRGMPLGVVTSKGTRMATRGLDLFQLRHYFSVVVSADDVEFHKPEPHPLIYAAEALTVDVERCAYVGDSPHDMNCAIAAGAVSIAALWGAFSKEEVTVPGPDFALGDISDLERLLSGDYSQFVPTRA